MDAPAAQRPLFSGYEKFIIAILTILQFTVILDFMVLSPLGAILMPALKITPQQFGWVVSAYAFSACLLYTSEISRAAEMEKTINLRILPLSQHICYTLLCV